MSTPKAGQLPLIGETEDGRPLAVGHAPDWYTPSSERKQANRRVASGQHPVGGELGMATETCGSCVQLYAIRHAKTYLKCALVPATGGPATDVRRKWRACEQWASGEDS